MQDEPRNSSFFTAARRDASIDVAGDHQVVVEEFRRPRVVGEDAADRRRGDEHRIGPGGGEPGLGLALPAQIELPGASR